MTATEREGGGVTRGRWQILWTLRGTFFVAFVGEDMQSICCISVTMTLLEVANMMLTKEVVPIWHILV